MSSTTFTRGDAINVYYPPEDPYYHGTYPAYFIKEYKGSNCSRVLWVGECEFKNSTTTVKNKYITLDAKRSRASDEFIKEYVIERQSQAVDEDSESDDTEDIEDSVVTPGVQPKRKASMKARQRIKRQCNIINNKISRRSSSSSSSSNSSSSSSTTTTTTTTTITTTTTTTDVAISAIELAKIEQKKINEKWNEDVKKALCMICGEGCVETSENVNNLLFCEFNIVSNDRLNRGCMNAMHIHCMSQQLKDDFDTKSSSSVWMCPMHRPKTNDNKILHVKKFGGFNQPQYKKLVAGFDWQDLSDEEWIQYCKDNKYTLMCQSKLGIDTKIERIFHPHNLIEKKYRFSKSNTYYGITQYENYLTKSYINSLQEYIDNLFARKMQDAVQTANNINCKVTVNNTLDLQGEKKMYRLKIFLGYRYSYGKNKKLDTVYNDVDKLEYHNIFCDLIKKIKNIPYLKEKNFNPNQVVINLYQNESSKLNAHVDSKKLFKRPIVSVRLFSAAKLMFGIQGLGMKPTHLTVAVPQQVGEITLMEGFAANNFNHGISNKSLTAKSVSILIREVREEAIKEMEERNPGPPPENIAFV